MKELTPREIVAELDKYIVGQADAKKSVAIAIRNRWRRQQLPPDLREEVAPKNIIMIGPTGVGKTEIARRLATLVSAPFLKVEASKYTEVGYHGRDVESMIRDLVEIAINMVQKEEYEKVEAAAAEAAHERLLDLLLPTSSGLGDPDIAQQQQGTREKLSGQLDAGKLEDRMVEMDVQDRPPVMMQGFVAGPEELGFDVQNMLERIIPSQSRERRMKVKEARQTLIQEEAEKLIDKEAMTSEALERAQDSGIIFIDEIDKVAGRESAGRGPDVSREGVQRDLLPLVEGCTVPTRYGIVRTDHILFIAAGAFHVAKPSDLVPEMQGRFPIRVELGALGKDEFMRILVEPQNALTKQYTALLGTEEVELTFAEDGIAEIAHIAAEVNESTENIGARRLHTVMERMLEDISFDAPDTKETKLTVDAAYVKEKLADVVKDQDLSKYIL